MALRNIIDAALAIAQGTGRIGRVYKHRVWSATDVDVKNLFLANGRLDVCFITRESTEAQDLGPNNAYRFATLVLDWYRAKSRAADDSVNSEDGFQDDVEAVMDAFDANRRFTTGAAPNQVKNATWSGPMKARVVNVVTFAGVMCDHAELVTVVKDGPRTTTSS